MGKSGKRTCLKFMNEEKRKVKERVRVDGFRDGRALVGGLCVLMYPTICRSELGIRWGDSLFSAILLLFIRMGLVDGYEVILKLL